jgi:hypothetical protein
MRVSDGVHFLAIAVVVVSAWEIFAGGLMDPDPSRLLWLVPAIAGFEAVLASRRERSKSGSGATRAVARVDRSWSRRAGVWIPRFGAALAIVAAWNALKALVELGWIDVRPVDLHAWSSRLFLWTVLLLVGIGLSRPWGADVASPAGELPSRPREEC